MPVTAGLLLFAVDPVLKRVMAVLFNCQVPTIIQSVSHVPS